LKIVFAGAASLQPRGSGLVAHLIERRIIRHVTHSIVGVRDHRSAAEWRLLFEVFVNHPVFEGIRIVSAFI